MRIFEYRRALNSMAPKPYASHHIISRPDAPRLRSLEQACFCPFTHPPDTQQARQTSNTTPESLANENVFGK